MPSAPILHYSNSAPNYMKPDSNKSRKDRRSEGNNSPSRRVRPLVDYSFHARTTELPATGARNANRSKRSVIATNFRHLSAEFLGAETTRNYLAELLFFAIIAGVSAWPAVSVVQALAQLTK